MSARLVVPFEPRPSLHAPLARRSAVEALADALRTRILDGDLAAGQRLVEQELTAVYDVARHTVRSALRALQAEGLVSVEPNRGARVAQLDADAVCGLYELRTALEVEAARRALERGDGRLPQPVHDALGDLVSVCRRRRPSWSDVTEAHDALHRALVQASGSTRLAAAHAALEGEMRLFLVQLRPAWTLDRMADDHADLVEALERDGADALREHLRASAEAVLGLLGEPAAGGD